VVGFVAELQQFDPTTLTPDPDLYGSQQSPADGLTPVVPVVPPPPGLEPSVVPASVAVEPTDLYAALAAPSLDESDPRPTDLYAALAEPRLGASGSAAADAPAEPSELSLPDSAGARPMLGAVVGWDREATDPYAVFAERAAGSPFPTPVSAGSEVPRPRRHVPVPVGSATGRVVLEWGPARSEVTVTPIDITPGTVRPSSSTGGLRRRIRVAMVAGAVVAALVAGGVGYAALNQSGDITAAPEPRTSISALPTMDGRIGSRVSRVYSRPPVDRQLSASATRTSAPTRSQATGKPAAGVVVVAPGRSTSPTPARTTAAQHQPPAQAEPGQGGGPGYGQGGGPGQGGQRPLAATFTHTGEPGPDGVSMYTGTIRVDNLGRRPVDGWQVELEVPGGNSISTDGAGSAQDGDHVTFTPFEDAGTISPGDSVTFTFTVYGVLPAEPSGCTVNGRACD
jgi:hypothetical protein